jgi:hypothetical protein
MVGFLVFVLRRALSRDVHLLRALQGLICARCAARHKNGLSGERLARGGAARHPCFLAAPCVQGGSDPVRIALPPAHVTQRAPGVIIRPNEQGEDLLPHVHGRQKRLRRPTPTPQRRQQLHRQPLRLLQRLRRERRMTDDIRPALAEHRHQRQDVACQATVPPLLPDARQRLPLDPARVRQAPRLTEQLLAQPREIRGKGRHGLPL